MELGLADAVYSNQCCLGTPGSDSLIKLDEQRRADNLSDSFKNYVRILNRSRMYIIQMYQVKLWRGLKLKEEALIGAMFDGVMIS